MDIAARLIAFKETTGLTNSQFADQAGIPRPTLSQFLNGRNKRLSDDLTAKLHAAFPSLNVMWLLFGEGNMLNDSNIGFSAPKNDEISADSESQQPENKEDSPGETPDESCKESESIQKINAPDAEYGRREPSQAFREEDSQPLQSAPKVPVNPAKQIQSIMVFYTDNSFEIFTPSK